MGAAGERSGKLREILMSPPWMRASQGGTRMVMGKRRIIRGIRAVTRRIVVGWLGPG